jgi:PAS domain-containing protein
MLEAGIPAILGSLSNDLILVCDEAYVVQEANALACHILGTHMIGQPLINLLHRTSQDKGQAFLEHTRSIAAGETGDTWELLFAAPDREPLLISMRAGRSEHGTWLLVGMCESPQFTALYHEVLSINSQLTNLVRHLSKEQSQSRLNNPASHLM